MLFVDFVFMTQCLLSSPAAAAGGARCWTHVLRPHLSESARIILAFEVGDFSGLRFAPDVGHAVAPRLVSGGLSLRIGGESGAGGAACRLQTTGPWLAAFHLAALR